MHWLLLATYRWRQRLIKVALFACIATAANADPITVYDVNLTIFNISVTGNIVTDGTTGALAQANIVDWNLTISSVAVSGPFDQLLGPVQVGNNSQVQLVGQDLIVNGQSLIFIPTYPNGGFAIFNPAPPSDTALFAFSTSDPAGAFEELFSSVTTGFELEPFTTALTIGTAQTPEPGTLAMLLIGGMLIFAAARYRARYRDP